jgi:hypothetical protein
VPEFKTLTVSEKRKVKDTKSVTHASRSSHRYKEKSGKPEHKK